MSDLQAKLADAIAAALKARDDAHLHDGKDARFAERTEWLELLERELSDVIVKIGLLDTDDPDTPDEIRRLFAPINEPTHQVDLLFSIAAGFGMVMGGAAAAFSGGAQALENKSMRRFLSTYLDPEIAAAAQIREFISDPVANDWYDNKGLTTDKRRALIDLAWQHLPPATAMELLRLGHLEWDQVRDILKAQGIPPEERAALMLTLTGPIDLGMAVAAVTQSQIDRPTFVELLGQNGVHPKWADVIFKTAGQSPPVEMTLELWNRGLIEEWQVDKIVLESPIKNEYVDVLKKMRFRFPPLEQTTTLMRRGIMTADEGIDAIKKLGYTDDLARKMAEYATAEKHAATKEISMAQTIALYDEQLIDRGAASADLVSLGYDATESELLLKLAESRRDRRRQAQAVNRVHTKYVTFKIDESEATAALDALRVPTTARQEYLDTWEIERDISSLHLSRVDIKKAVKMGALTVDAALTRLRAMGYDETDVAVLRVIDGYDTPADA